MVECDYVFVNRPILAVAVDKFTLSCLPLNVDNYDTIVYFQRRVMLFATARAL
jgi:hypothetical protein